MSWILIKQSKGVYIGQLDPKQKGTQYKYICVKFFNYFFLNNNPIQDNNQHSRRICIIPISKIMSVILDPRIPTLTEHMYMSVQFCSA